MKAYRINLIGSQGHYLITEKQKPTFEALLKGNKVGVVSIGGDIIRSSAIKSITSVNVDLEACPDYFTEVVKREESDSPTSDGPAYRKLPTEWIILDLDGKILATDISRSTTKRISEALAPEGKRFRQAKCHYRIGTTGEKEFITNLTMIPEALEFAPDAEDPGNSPIVDRWLYGQKQW